MLHMLCMFWLALAVCIFVDMSNSVECAGERRETEGRERREHTAYLKVINEPNLSIEWTYIKAFAVRKRPKHICMHV